METSFRQSQCPHVVIHGLFLMVSAIYLNDQHYFQAYEIENVVTKRVLTAKLEA